MKRITSSLLALLLALSMLIGMVPAAYAAPADTIESIDSTETVDSTETEDVSDESEDVAAYAADTELTNYVVVKGIKGFEGKQFATFEAAYNAIKPVMETLGLGEDTHVSTEAFDALFTDVTDGKATLTYTITGNVTYDETGLDHLLTMGRKTSHYLTNERHLINFKFIGATPERGATLTVNSNITLPYEWWGEKVTTSISFENLTITGSAPSGLYPHQAFFEGIDFAVNNCTLNGIKIYNCSNVGGKYTITNSTLNGTGAPVDAYAIHLQGNESAPLTIKIDNNQISGYDRGINIDQNTAVAEITGNKISIKDAGRSCIQLSRLAKTTVSGNKLALTGGNAITLHECLLGTGAVPEITVTGNNITGSGYLIYDDAVANEKAFTSKNLNFTFDNTNTVASTVDKKTGVKGGVEYDLSEIVDNKVNGSSTPGVAMVGTTTYNTLEEAISALNSTDYTLTLLDESAWDTATPVYWEAGTQRGYVAKLTDALTAAYKVGADKIKIVCRPDTDVGTMTHGHVADNITIYGNNAYISGGECELEVDTYKFSRETGAQDTTNGESLTKDITITAYELDNLGVWGQRTTGYTVTVNLTDCDGKAIEGKENVQRVYISGTSGVNNITLTGCDFMTNNTSVYSNADGAISIKGCSFTGSKVPVNFNHKANGEQRLTVSNSTFKNCGDNGEWNQFAAPVRFVNSGSGTQTASVNSCTFTETVGSNGDILIGDGRTGEKSNDVSLTVTGTTATVKAQKPGYYDGAATDTSKGAEKNVTSSETVSTSIADLVKDASVINDEKSLRKALYEAPTDGTVTTIKLEGDVTLEMLYAAENFGTEKLEDNAEGDTFNRYKRGVHPTENDPDHWNPLVTGQTQEERVVYGAYYHMSAGDERIARLVVKAGQSIVLDLNGHTIQKKAGATHGDWSVTCTDILGNYGTLTITDTSNGEKGTIKGLGYTTCQGAVLHNYKGAVMNVGAIDVDGNAAGMKAGTGQYVVYNEGGNLSINGANIFDTATSASLLVNTAGAMSVKNAQLYHPATKAINAKDGTVTIGENVEITSDASAIFATGSAVVTLNVAPSIKASAEGASAGTLVIEGDNATIKKDTSVEMEAPAGYEWRENVLVKKTVAAKIGSVEYGTLTEAIAAVNDGETIVVNAGTYAITELNGLSNANKAITITAADNATVILNAVDQGDVVYVHGAKITFNGITFNWSNDDYRGFKHASELVYNNCTINGKVFLYAASETFNNCTFNQTAEDYNVWTYGAKKVAFNKCTFNCKGKAVNVYIEANNASKEPQTIEVTDVTVKSEKANKAFLNIKNSTQAYNVSFSGTNTVSGLDADGTTGSNLYQVEQPTITETSGNPVTIKEKQEDGTFKTVYEVKAPTANGTEAHPYTLDDLSTMTRAEYIAAQTSLGGTMYVTVGDYSYDTNGVLGNGERNDTPGQTPDHSKLNAYGENGYLDEGNDGANGKNIVFVGGKITSNVTGYESIDKIGTSLLLAVPAYTNVTFKGITFNNVMSFNYQLYTSPWSQLGELKFDGCTFNGIIVGAIAAQTLTFNKCTFANYTNTVSANSSNPTWIRPAYGNWTKGDNEGQGGDFKSLTTISFTGNTVTSTRPVKFERIAQWEMDTTVTATGNSFDISAQEGETSTKNVGLYFGANAKFDLVVEGNTKNGSTAALYTAVYSAPNGGQYAGLPAGSTVKDSNGQDAVLEDAYEWKSTKKLTLKTTEEVAELSTTDSKNNHVTVRFATLAAAVKAAKPGDTITLLDNIKLTAAQTISKKLTIDLNGKTLDSTAYQTIKLNAGADLTVMDSGTNGKITNSYAPGSAYPSTIYLNEPKTAFTLVSGTIESDPNETSLQSVAINSKKVACTVNIQGGSVVVPAGATEGRSIVAGKDMTLNISGGTITGGLHGVDAYGGSTVNITGGKVTATHVDTGVIKEAYGMRIIGTANVTINGGEIQGIKMDDDGYKLNVPNVTLVSGKVNGSFYSISIGTIVFTVDPTATITFEKDTVKNFLPSTVELVQNENGTYGVTKKVTYVAEVNGTKYETLQAAIDAAPRKGTVKLLANTRENVTIDKMMTLDLNGHTLNGGTEKGKPALTITARTVTIKDSSAAQTGTIMREDTAENSGVSSHYVIDIQGNAWVMFESGNVKNNSGNTAGKGASLVRVGDDSVAEYPGLNIKGGTFTQDNFIVIKVDRGDLFLNGGTLNSANSYAIEDWHRATIKGGTVNGAVAAWTYSGGLNSDLTISGGTINGDVTSVNYGNAEGRTAKVSITGGRVTGELDTRSYNPATSELTSIDDATKATIKVTGGTFEKDPTKYVVEDSMVKKNDDGTFGVEKAYLAKIGDTSYYTMEEAFEAQTASGEPIVLLRDYTRGSPFNSGSINRTVDLDGHTWTCTGTDVNSAAFEINHSNVTLTVKNGKIVSSQLVGLIPSAMGGTIKYDNSGLVFEGVEMSTTATSGIETNGNNTNDSVTLKNSTLNVPNGFGIYFPSSGTLTIENSTINAKTMGVQVCAGSLKISGADTAITVTGDAVPKTENDGAIQDGAAISIVNRTGYKGLGTITVTDGTFTAKTGNAAIKAYNWANNTETKFTEPTKVGVSGGTFSAEVPADLCAPGYVPKDNGDGTYGVKEGTYVAAIGEKKYATLAAAVDAAQNGDTITLLADVEQNTMLVIKKDITLDLAGKKIFNTIDIWSVTNKTYELLSIEAKVTITGNGTIDAKADDCYTINVKNGDLTIENGTFFGNVSVVQVEKGKLTINGGKFDLHQKWEGKNTYLINCIDDAFVDKTAEVAIYGGEFVDFDPNVSPEKKIDGKTPSFAAPGVGITKNENNTFTAQAGMAAQIVDADGNSVAAYATLKEAVNAAKSGETVIVLKEATVEERITAEANITIDLNQKTVTVADGAGTMLKTTGDVTIKNGILTSAVTANIIDAYGKLKLESVKIYGSTVDGSNLVNVLGNAEVTIDAASEIEADGVGVAVFVGAKSADKDAKYTLNIYGKVIQKGKSYAISGNGSYPGTSYINIYEGAEVKANNIAEKKDCCAIYQPQAGEINVYGGLVEGYCAIVMKSGTLNISGGTVRGIRNDNVLGDNNSAGNGASYDGSAIVVDSRKTGYAGNVKINVTGGTVESYYSTAIREIGNDSSMTQLVELTVTGGEIRGASKNLTNAENDILVRDISVSNVAISGGTFNHEVQADYCAVGYEPSEKDASGMYTVQKVSGNAYYVDNGKPVYGDLEKLLADSATNSKAIMLLDDVVTYGTDFLYLRANKTIDLNGKTLVLPGKLFGFGKIIDSTDGAGLLKIGDMDGSQLPSDNGYLPVLDKAVEGYRLYSYTMKLFKTGYNVVGNGNTVKFAVQIEFANLDAWNKIAVDDNSVELVFEAKWNTNVSIFRFEDTQLDKIAKDVTEEKRIGYFILTINGFNNISGVEFRMTPQIKCKLFTQTIDTIIYK